MFNGYYNYWWMLYMLSQQNKALQHRQNQIEEQGGVFSFLQNVSKPCVNPNFSFVRVFNAITEPIKLNVYIDDVEIARNLEYKDFSNYVPIPKGDRNIKIYSDQQPDSPLIELNNVDIPTNQIATLVTWKVGESLQTMILIDDVTQQLYRDKTVFRIVNVSTDNLSINITSPDAQYNVNRNLRHGEYDGYLTRNPGLYTFVFTLSSQEQSELIRRTLNNRAERIYTEYIVGTMDTNSVAHQEGYYLEFVLSIDGNIIIKQCP
jgi:Domain of unknown function (DUF4397)